MGTRSGPEESVDSLAGQGQEGYDRVQGVTEQ